MGNSEIIKNRKPKNAGFDILFILTASHNIKRDNSPEINTSLSKNESAYGMFLSIYKSRGKNTIPTYMPSAFKDVNNLGYSEYLLIGISCS